MDMRPHRRALPFISLLLTLVLSIKATHADTMRRIEAPERPERASAGTGPIATLPLHAGIPDTEPDPVPGSEPAENDSIPGTGPVVTKGMATGYAVCGLVILTGIILVKAVAHSTERAVGDAAEGFFPPVTGKGAD